MKKIANPLKIGIMHEAAFVLGREWPDLLTRKAGTAAEVTVSQLRGWIGEEQPGLPEHVQSLLIACYAVQADKALAVATLAARLADLKHAQTVLMESARFER